MPIQDRDPSKQPLRLPDLFSLGQHPERVKWESFRPGVRIHRIYGNQSDGPSAALLWYEPGAGIPMHEHLGYEHLLILSGTQVDGAGATSAGTFVVNPPGRRHRVSTPEGAVVLAIWEKPVRILEE
jgi:anti-sigma factor ChrR (cupin superfamily)